jgi:hypothetical protein
LGLGPPTPNTTNICERLVDRLVIPKTEVFCDLPWYARIFMPHCNLPGACHVDPACKSFEVTREVAEVVLNAGDLYCDFRETTPERIIEGIRNQTFTDLVKLTTGGTSSILFDVANRHIDLMSCNGSHLNEKLQEWVACVASKSTVPQDMYFYPIDVDRAVIISKTNPTADLYLRPTFGAITLDDVVIIEDDEFQILRNWSKGTGEALMSDEQSALRTMIHELVHVRQYRNIGKESFINLYLTEAIANGYANISMEQEAKQYEDWAFSILSTPNLCAQQPPQPMPPSPQTQCLADCASERDSCMADVATQGGPRPQECVAQLRACRASCRP